MTDLTIPADQKEQFQQQVWELARQIPPGQVASYGQLAGFIPAPPGVDAEAYAAQRARWVGAAMRECPADVPWQRVLNAQGKISLPAGSRGALEQRRLLEAEGVVFQPNGKVDRLNFNWPGPPRAWLLERGLLPAEDDFHQGQLF